MDPSFSKYSDTIKTFNDLETFLYLGCPVGCNKPNCNLCKEETSHTNVTEYLYEGIQKFLHVSYEENTTREKETFYRTKASKLATVADLKKQENTDFFSVRSALFVLFLTIIVFVIAIITAITFEMPSNDTCQALAILASCIGIVMIIGFVCLYLNVTRPEYDKYSKMSIILKMIETDSTPTTASNSEINSEMGIRPTLTASAAQATSSSGGARPSQKYHTDPQPPPSGNNGRSNSFATLPSALVPTKPPVFASVHYRT